MFDLSSIRRTRFLPAVAIVAVALVLGLQALELQHQHGLDESQVECTLCKTSAEQAPAHSSDAAPAEPTRSFTTVLPVQAGAENVSAHHFIRGPPLTA